MKERINSNLYNNLFAPPFTKLFFIYNLWEKGNMRDISIYREI